MYRGLELIGMVHAAVAAGHGRNVACFSCGYAGPLLTVDHINGDGGVKGENGRKSVRFARSVAKRARVTGDLQLLCAACHLEKTKFEKSGLMYIEDYREMASATWELIAL